MARAAGHFGEIMRPFEHHGFRQGRLKVAVAASIMVSLGSNCPTSAIPEQGDIDVTILRAVDRVGQLCPITSVNFAVDPVAVPPRKSGSTVGTTAIPAKFTNYSGGTGSTNRGTAQFPIVCVHSQTFPALAAGTWAVTGKAVRGNSFTCNKVVPAGGTVAATWVFNQGGTAESCM
jgi:hypothetical protein